MSAASMSFLVKAHKLSESMLRALYTGENGESVFCGVRTERALIARDLIHPVQSTLTQKGTALLAQLRDCGESKARALPRTAADLPKGTRVASPEGRLGTALGCWTGRVTNDSHPNYGREYIGVEWDANTQCPWGERSRPFVDELTVIGGAA